MKQVALTLALALPLLLTVAFSGPFTAWTSAQGGQRMVGPQFPILIDTNGDGQPTPGADTPANPVQASATTLQLTSLFSCGNQPNTVVTLSGQDSAGKFRTTSRTNNGRNQAIAVTGFSGGGASTFGYTETNATGVRAQGSGALVDTNGDGRMDTLNTSGGISTTISLVFTPGTSYVSIPVSQATLLGARRGRCGPASVPQVWVPMADINADGIGDGIVLDLDGNGIADSQYYTSPPLGAVGVPTTNSVGLLILTLLLGAAGVWYLGQRRLGEAGPAA